MTDISETEVLSGLSRREYLRYKLRSDVKFIGIIFVVCWILGFDLRSLAYLAAADLFILALAGIDHARKWERARAADPHPGA